MDVLPLDLGVHLADLQRLLNRHVAAVVPGWGVTREFITENLGRRTPGPGTEEAICALEGRRFVAALGLRHHGDGPEVVGFNRGLGVINWLLVDPAYGTIGTELIAEARRRLQRLGSTRASANWDVGLPLPYGVADTWTHLIASLEGAGFAAAIRPYWVEEVWGGPMPARLAAPSAPVEMVQIRRRLGDEGTEFLALADGVEVGHCDCVPGLSRSGRLPLLDGWGQIADLFVEEAWRGRGVGTTLMNHATSWMRLAGCARVVLSVPSGSDSPEAHRFYPRFGWSRWATQFKVWQPRDQGAGDAEGPNPTSRAHVR